MMTDFRKLCKELVQAWDEHGGCGIPYHEACWSLAVDKVRKVLDEVVEEGPTDDEWYTLVDRVWDKYETIGYQGERIMHCSDFGNALDIVRKEFTRYGRGENNVQ